VDDPQRILIIRPSALGDVCRSVPLLATLRRAHPGAAIDWLVRDDFQDAVTAHPDLTRVVPFPRREFGRALKRLNPRPALGWLASLRRARYDLVIDAQGLARSGIFAWATRAPTRVGDAHARELAWLAYTRRVPVVQGAHTVDRMLALLEAIGLDPLRDMRLHAPAQDRDAVARDDALRHDRYVVLAPTSVWPAKRWPIDRFVSLATALLDAGAEQIVVVGAPGERDQCAPLLDLASTDPRVVDLVGATGVGRLMGVIERAALVVANDSAALHIGVGFDRPLVALFGPTNTGLVGPYGRERDVLQHLREGDSIDHKRESGRALMERVTLDEVRDASLARLGLVSRSSPRSPS